jgi:hypothetical protein
MRVTRRWRRGVCRPNIYYRLTECDFVVVCEVREHKAVWAGLSLLSNYHVNQPYLFFGESSLSPHSIQQPRFP